MKDLKFHLGFGPQFESYAPTELSIRGPVIDAAFQNVNLHSRGTMSTYAQPEKFRWIDEPTNHFFFEVRYKERWAFGVEVYHPKVVLGSDEEGPSNHDVRAKGRIGSETVDGSVDLNARLPLLQLTKGFMNYGTYVDRIEPIVSGKAGTLNLRYGIGTGVYTGYAKTIYEGQTEDNKLSVIGGSVTARTALEYAIPGSYLTVRANLDATFGGVNFAVLSGRGSFGIQSIKGGLSLSAGF